MKTIAEALAELKINKPDGKAYVHDWQKQIPDWSKWTPGSLGKPDCVSCKGLGVVRVDVPHYTHPFFGKLFACECQAGPALQMAVLGLAKLAVPPPTDDTEARRARSIERVRKDLE